MPMPLLILIAEDDPSIRLAVSDYLEFSGYSVITAEDGDIALSSIEKYHPHLVISDIKMPGKNGYDLIKTIRQLPKFRLLPVIFLTEYRKTEDRIRGYQAGCDIYLPKPFELEELGAVIRNLLERTQIIHSELRFIQETPVRLDEEPTYQTNIDEIKESSVVLPPFEGKRRSLSDREDIVQSLDLTQREREVLELLIKGFSNTEIGKELHLSPRTIEKHVSSLLRKSKSNNRIELVRLALESYLTSY
jgi:DNA-binding NarL/FixJ family response regulator